MALAIGATASMGWRDVQLSIPSFPTRRSSDLFTVTPPPPTLGLAFLGKLRDKVGQGNGAFSADGALDGSFRVTSQAGTGARTVTRLELRRTGGGGVWDTDPATAHWALGAAGSLDGALLDTGTGTVSFGVAAGGAFFVFASDLNPTLFGSGAGFTLTANFGDGTSAGATVSLPLMPTIGSVSPSSGVQGASLTVTVTGANFQAGASAGFGAGITVSPTTVVSAAQLPVGLGAGASLDGALLNAGTGTVSFGVADGGAFFVFASDLNPTVFGSGAGFTLIANFADGTSASASASVPLMPTIGSVSPSSGVQGASLTVTVTGANFQAGASAGFGAGITVGSTPVATSAPVPVPMASGATAAMGARDVTV